MIAYSYLRVSGRTQVDGDGPERQDKKIREFCARHGLDRAASAVFDEGVSGTIDGMDRPALGELIARMQPGDAIVVERMDRLARDLLVQEMLLAECSKRKLKVYAADNELVDMASNEGDPTRVLIRQILGALAQWEKSVIVAKLKAGAERKRRETGRCGGVAPYGQLDAHEKALLANMLAGHAAGCSLQAMADQMNLRGDKTRHGKDWTKARVHNAIARHIKKNI